MTSTMNHESHELHVHSLVNTAEIISPFSLRDLRSSLNTFMPPNGSNLCLVVLRLKIVDLNHQHQRFFQVRQSFIFINKISFTLCRGFMCTTSCSKSKLDSVGSNRKPLSLLQRGMVTVLVKFHFTIFILYNALGMCF